MCCTLASFAMASTPLPSSPLVRDEPLTLPELAKLLKVAENTVYTMAEKGELPAFTVRGQQRFRRRDVDEWIGQQVARTTNKSQAPQRPREART